MDDVRRLIVEAMEERGLEMKAVSLALGRNHAYLQQFISRGVPDRLPESVRPKLAEILGVTEVQLGAPAKARGADNLPPMVVTIPEHDVRASAGGGSMIEDETEIDSWPLPRRYIRDTLSLRSNSLAIIEVIGDSMEPTLRSGDKIMIDLNDKSYAQPGVFALFDGDATVVKRLEKVPASETVRISSDNPNHGRYEVPIEHIHVAGRVVWFGRRL